MIQENPHKPHRGGDTRREAPQAGPLEVKKGTGSFAGGVAALGGGAVAAHLIAFGSAPVISRLFAPEAFGAAAIFAGIVMVLGTVASLRYESALMLPRRDRDAANLLAVCCLAVVAATGFVCAAAWFFGRAAAELLRAPALARLSWLLPVAVFTWGLGLPLRAWATRYRRFRSLAAVNVAETATSSAARIASGWAGLIGAGPLIVTGVVARAVPSVALTWQLIRRDARFLASRLSLREMMRLARQYARWPLVDSWTAILGCLARQAPFMLLGASLGTAVVGHYSRALLITQLPLLLAGNAVGQVFFQRAAAQKAAGEPIARLVEQVFQRLIWISLLPLAVVALIGPEVFTVVLGSQWRQAGLYARPLAAWMFLASLAVPLWPLVSVLRRLGVGLAFSLAFLGLQAAALVAGGWLLRDGGTAVLLLAAAGAVVNGGLCLFLLAAAGASLPRVGKCLVRYVAYSLPTLGVAAAAKWWLEMPAWQIVIAAAVASVSYVVAVLRHDRWLRRKMDETVGRVTRRLHL